MGAYHHVAPRIKTCMLEEGRQPPHQLPYAGRPPCASTATGFGKVRPRLQHAQLHLHEAGADEHFLCVPQVHAREQAELVAEAMEVQ